MGIEVRQAEWSLRDLGRFQEAVRHDTDWLTAIDASVLDVDLAVEDNAVRLRYESPHDGDERRIAEHFGSPSWLAVEWEGPPPWTGARGDLVVRAVNGFGRPVAGLMCDARPVDPAVRYSIGVALLTGTDGRCTFESVPARGFIGIVTDGSHQWTGRTNVPADGVGRITIVVP